MSQIVPKTTALARLEDTPPVFKFPPKTRRSPDKDYMIQLRQAKIINLRAKGYTVTDIAKLLKVSRQTVTRDLKSVPIADFVDELIREQLRDLRDPELEVKERLKWRSDLIGKMSPRPEVAKVEGDGLEIVVTENVAEAAKVPAS